MAWKGREGRDPDAVGGCSREDGLIHSLIGLTKSYDQSLLVKLEKT